MNAVWIGAACVLIASLGGLALVLRRGQPSFHGTPDTSLPLDLSNPLLCNLRRDLHALDAMPLTSKEDLTRWYDAADDFRVKLRHEYAPIYDSLPHELEHYLADADIRAKDPGYADQQKRKLAGFFPDNTNGESGRVRRSMNES